MHFSHSRALTACALLLVAGLHASALLAQEPARPVLPPTAPAPQFGQQAPQFVSAEVAADRRLTFRIFAPRAQAVRISASDIPGLTPAAAAMTKAENGVWEVTVGPVDPGAYRYTFNVDGVATTDPRSAAVSEANTNVWSIVVVPGNDLFDTRNVPRGAVAAVTYWSSALGTFRRMHVYTPPGYDLGSGQYPVFYLLHGAGDNDHAWPTVGRAGFILDNLIAAKKARPMVVVMPAGHLPRTAGSAIGTGATKAFVDDFVKDVMPYVESHYRVRKDRANTAIAGLSMGGGQTLAVAIPRLGRFGYIGVFSSGLLGGFPDLAPRGRGGMPAAAPAAPPRAAQGPPPQTAAEWEKEQAATLDDAALKKGLRLLWFRTGKDDFLLTTTQATVDLFKKHGFAPDYVETPGAHTWVNWRIYLSEFAPLLFQVK
jgi:enterochelin esterase-like enzyme